MRLVVHKKSEHRIRRFYPLSAAAHNLPLDSPAQSVFERDPGFESKQFSRPGYVGDAAHHIFVPAESRVRDEANLCRLVSANQSPDHPGQLLYGHFLGIAEIEYQVSGFRLFDASNDSLDVIRHISEGARLLSVAVKFALLVVERAVDED
jgi:hypothetical protein